MDEKKLEIEPDDLCNPRRETFPLDRLTRLEWNQPDPRQTAAQVFPSSLAVASQLQCPFGSALSSKVRTKKEPPILTAVPPPKRIPGWSGSEARGKGRHRKLATTLPHLWTGLPYRRRPQFFFRNI